MKRKQTKTHMPKLPGDGPQGPEPQLPGFGPQPSPEAKKAIEDGWNKLIGVRQALAEIIDVINRHPELLEWAKAAPTGTLAVPKQ